MTTPINALSSLEAAYPAPPSVGKCLLTKKELSVALPMPLRTIDKLVANGTIVALRITPRMIRFELPAVLAGLRRYQTASLRK